MMFRGLNTSFDMEESLMHDAGRAPGVSVLMQHERGFKNE